jgi:hypothetical protein
MSVYRKALRSTVDLCELRNQAGSQNEGRRFFLGGYIRDTPKEMNHPSRFIGQQSLSKLTVSGSKLGFIASGEWSKHDTTAAYVGR